MLVKESADYKAGRIASVSTAALIAGCLYLMVPSVSAMASASTAASVPKNIVVVGGGIQGTSVAYQLAKRTSPSTKIVLLESEKPASAASGKGGGFMARSWGNGSPTERLHHVAFDMYGQLAAEVGCTSYRKLPVLSVSPGYDGIKLAQKKKGLSSLLPSWLDGKVGRIGALGDGQDTAQITPKEFVNAMLEQQEQRIQVVKGTCVGVESDQGSQRGARKVTAVQYQTSDDTHEPLLLPADCVVVSAGPWSCAAEDWFRGSGVQLPMEGVKSTSIVWKKPSHMETVDGTALFCGEDDRFGTHLEVYPRPDNTIYICGIGGSDYISMEDLKGGAFRSQCDAKEQRVEAAMASFQEMSSVYKQEGELDRSQACMRPCPPDAMPYMGPIPGYEGAFINAGHNCWGIAWAPACGLAMAELIVDGESSTIDLAPFDPCRFTPNLSRGSRGRKRQGQDVGEQW
uniref:FAD dependent oxidoreductase domain-containing protein n=1 Tax=Entomoneis paludosa TaxID=265537 RepID=A0A7S2YFH0_9STRA|mmetsp:Transcript_3060/g.6273  ORF Transcript_3060/g.6273 Transcript_3060/m.6273 type:complete len:457 (+) Transcript_3060:139-1509(+)